MPQDDKLEQLYAELHDAMRYDAMSLCALALLLNKNKKNSEFMKFASAELGRNARHVARAVDYFRVYFDDTMPDVVVTADDYLKLFAYASLKHELAMECFAKWKFDYPLHVIRERVQAAKPKRERKASLAERVAYIIEAWMTSSDSITPSFYLDGIADIPEVKHILERKPADREPKWEP